MFKKMFEVFTDEKGSTSISRVQAVITFAFVLGGTTLLTVKAGVPVEIPESWLTMLGIATGGYLGAKGIMLGVGKVNLNEKASVEVGAGIHPAEPEAVAPATPALIQPSPLPPVNVEIPEAPKEQQPFGLPPEVAGEIIQGVVGVLTPVIQDAIKGGKK